MDGDRQNQNEFTIERGHERNASGGRSSPRGGASNAPPGKGQAEFDLEGSGERQLETGIPDQLRRKYYVAEAVAGDETKAYADARGEYLAFKVSAERMATRLEDAGVIRDMVSIAQHRSWSEVELRGSEEFRRTAWLEASVRGLSVRGHEPDPVDLAALSFRTKVEERSGRSPSQSRRPEPQASETISVSGVSTKRPIDVTLLPPEPRDKTRRQSEDGPARFQGSLGSDRASSRAAQTGEEQPPHRPALTIDVVPMRSETSRQSPRSMAQHRAEMFLSGNRRQSQRDAVVKAAQSQLTAIERALSKTVRDPDLLSSVLAHAKARIAEQLERGREFEPSKLRERTSGRPASERTTHPVRQTRSNVTDVYQDR